MNFIEGEVLLFDKPYKWTSFDLVNKVRWLISHYCCIDKVKVGHAGTLDPLATGLMVLCTGGKTRSIDLFSSLKKEYVAVIQLGESTPSYDLETDIDQVMSADHVTCSLLSETCMAFIGPQKQVPPSFSAVKVNGKRAYSLARKGVTPELIQKDIFIHQLEILRYDYAAHEVVIRVLCSKGTYIRSLVRDIAMALHTVGYLKNLRRTKIGKYTVDEALDVNRFEKMLITISSGDKWGQNDNSVVYDYGNMQNNIE